MNAYTIRLCFVLLTALVTYQRECFAQYRLRGTAKAISGTDCFQLTDRLNGEHGAVWYDQKLDLRTSFSLEFTLNFDNNPDGADGVVFVMQTVGPNALGTSGQGLGFAGFDPSLGVEFDTYINRDYGDPLYDHMAVLRDGSTNHFLPSNLTAPTRIKPNKDIVKDGLDYRIRIVWEAQDRRLKVLVDCEERINVTINLINDVFKGNPQVWWGFTASTGFYSCRQTVCLTKTIVEKTTYQVCQGEPVQLLGRPSVDNQYVWSPASGVDNPGIRNPIARPAQSQWYTVQTRGYCNTTTLDSLYVEVKPALSLELGADQFVCPDIQAVSFLPKISPDDRVIDYQWSTGANSPKLQVSQPGRYVLEISDGVCSARDTVQLSRLSSPNVRFPADKLYCLGEGPVTLSVETQEPNLSFSWAPYTGNQAVHTISSPGTYRVLVTNPDGCTVAQQFTVNEYCQPRIFIPGAFSPNGDNQNDELEVFHEGVSELELLIYNRWGSVIFSTTDPAKRWDGTYRDAPCDSGVYAYLLRYKSAMEPSSPFIQKTGQVILLR